MGVRVRFWKGAWYLFINHRGRRRAKKIGDRATALELARKVRARLAAGDLSLFGSDGEPLQAYAKRWLVGVTPNLKASTIAFYTGHLEQHIIPRLGSTSIANIRRADCRELVLACRAKGLKVTTVRGIARTLSTILSQAVDDELLPANPALRLGKYLRHGDEEQPDIDPFTSAEVAHVLDVAQRRFPEWYPWLLCGLRTGLRSGELLGLQWGDIDWRGSFLHLQRNIVRGQLTTPKNHQRRKVDLSPRLRAVLRLWRRQERAAWLKRGRPRPEWVFSSVTGTALDESNVRKALNRILDAAELHRRGPHQMRHTFASLLLQAGEPITYVSAQLGHRDASITLRVYAHWLPDTARQRGVDRLDTLHQSATSAQPEAHDREWRDQVSALESVVTLNFASWNQLMLLLRRIEHVRLAA